MADQKRVAVDVFDHLREDYAPALGWKHLRASDLDDLRFNATDADGTELIITARVVGGSSGNSQKYRGWVLESKPGWRRIEAERPGGFFGLLLMVGLRPNDEGIWWSNLYREDRLRGLTRYEIMNGRMSRVPESMAKAALVRKVDLLQTELFPADPPCQHPEIVRVIDGSGHACNACGQAFVPVGVG